MQCWLAWDKHLNISAGGRCMNINGRCAYMQRRRATGRDSLAGSWKKGGGQGWRHRLSIYNLMKEEMIYNRQHVYVAEGMLAAGSTLL